MKNLILALNQANLSPDGIETILTELEVWIDSKVVSREQKLMLETITPLHRETDGIRNEIRFLAETMKQGFALMEERFQKADQKWEERFQKMDQKLDFTRRQLEMQIAYNWESLESQIEATRKNLELQIISTRENLETQIKSNEKQLALVQKILWIVLTLVLGLFAKAIHLI